MENKSEHFCKNLSTPDERREFRAHGHLDLVQLGDVSIGRAEFDPGWTWEKDIKPLAGTDTCEAPHSGVCLAGSMVIQMNDGSEFTVHAGDAFVIPPGHLAWVEGNERCVMIDVGGYAEYARKASKAA